MSNQAQIQNILAQIATLPFEDQRMLNKMLVANLNASAKQLSRVNAIQFRVGQKVCFDAGPRKGGIVTVEITGFSRDMSKIKGKQIGGFRDGILWNASANLCKAA